jgi:putative ATP-dependent endonuclease of OLD family
VNIILGGGDVGKTTVLDAIALLLHPTNTTVLSDADYWQRRVEDELCIEAVMSIPDTYGISRTTKNAWPWEWDGKDPVLPKTEQESEVPSDLLAVYRFRVRGTSDFDLAYEVLQPDDTADHFSMTIRRRIGLVRLGGDDRNDRDLRLIQGSALDRLVADKTLRSRLGQKLGEGKIEEHLKDTSKTSLESLDTTFKSQALPTGLGLGLTGGQGLSLNALVGLTAMKSNVKLPLTSWGAGTRRLAAIEIASAHQGEHPIAVVDEVERGLEPYRQRMLLADLQTSGSQVFLTTHSSAALSAASNARVWYMDFRGAIGELPASLDSHRMTDPEAFLSTITIVAEGKTEYGFLECLLKRVIPGHRFDRGIWITDANGNDTALTILEGLANSGLKVAGFVDDEGRFPTKWAGIRAKLGNLLLRWTSGCLEENVLAFLPLDRLEEFIKDPDGDSGERLRTLADRLGINDKSFAVIRAQATDLKKLVTEAATGSVPAPASGLDRETKKAWKKHSQRWFKSIEGGNELCEKVFAFGLWPQIKPQMMPFLNAVRDAVSLPAIAELLS